MSAAHPPALLVREAVSLALREDLAPLGDLSGMLIDTRTNVRAHLVSRRAGVIAGMDCVVETCAQVDAALQVTVVVDDGGVIDAHHIVATIEGPLSSLVTAERTALNFLCHLSGVATYARAFVDAVKAVSSEVRVWDTRKTTPGLRALEKAAVRAGGAYNHRGNLSEAVLIKDNHLGGLSIEQAVTAARTRWPGRMVEVECDRIDQVHEALRAKASVIMLDNFSPEQAITAVAAVRSASHDVLVEASGGITLDNVSAFARSGVDLLSIGAMTHSAPVLDIGLDLETR